MDITIPNKKLFKIYLDLEFVFYNIDYDQILTNIVYDERELYDRNIDGISTFFKLEKSLNNYEYLPEINHSLLAHGQEYAILTYQFTSMFSTRAVTTVQNQKLVAIKVITHNKNK
ncbi:hypothetical protein GCM10023314_30590 [Algibacter agarivorans]|uniref:Uncharacterized protein n=1 Tax=Algibacter agarivorans TaxID=1109741 RepID=A0ABP9GZQ8_9FLAO